MQHGVWRIHQNDSNVIVYYGASGHGKGLVDAMSAFGVKRPMLKAVLTQNFKYNSAKDILDLLSSLFQDDPQKLYSLLNCDEIAEYRRDESSPLPITRMSILSYDLFPSRW